MRFLEEQRPCGAAPGFEQPIHRFVAVAAGPRFPVFVGDDGLRLDFVAQDAKQEFLVRRRLHLHGPAVRRSARLEANFSPTKPTANGVAEAGAMGHFRRVGRFQRVFRLGLMPAPMLALGERLPEGLQWGQVMLGSTLWVTGGAGDLERAEALLEGHGRVVRSKVDPNGARLVKAIPPPS